MLTQILGFGCADTGLDVLWEASLTVLFFHNYSGKYLLLYEPCTGNQSILNQGEDGEIAADKQAFSPTRWLWEAAVGKQLFL